MFGFVDVCSKNLQKHLIESGITPRRNAGSGLWLQFLLPLAIVLSGLRHSIFLNRSCSMKYSVAICISCGLLMYTLMLLLQLRKNIFSKGNFCVIPASLLSTALLYITTQEGFAFSIGYGVLSIFGYNKILLPVMKLCPKSFSYGESSVVAQAFILFLITTLIRNSCNQHDCFAISTIILQVGILCVLLIGSFSYVGGLTNKAKEFYILVLTIICCILLPSLYFLIGENPVYWILSVMTEDVLSVQLFGFWLFCSTLGILSVVLNLRRKQKASTVMRKIFHLLAVAVFLPGIVLKPCLIYLASGVTFGLFVGLDMLRVLSLPPLGNTLQASFNIFSDEKDEGPIALTPLYLLTGCALPLWIHPNPYESGLLLQLAGVLSVGIGDTAASICGILAGKNKWPGSQKTKEGSAACFLSQLFFVIALIHFGYISGSNLIKPTFAIAVISFVEAKTDQVDNLCLPLLMYNILLI